MEFYGAPPIGQKQGRPAQRAPRWGTVSFRMGRRGGWTTKKTINVRGGIGDIVTITQTSEIRNFPFNPKALAVSSFDKFAGFTPAIVLRPGTSVDAFFYREHRKARPDERDL